MKQTGLWTNLEKFAVPATVLAEWRMVLGAEYADAQPFLRATQEQAEGYPCTNQPSCECRHEVVAHSPKNMVAACRCEPRECRSIRLEPRDLLIYALDTRKLCGAIARVFKFEGATDGSGLSYGALKIWPVGTYRRTHSPVYLALCPTEELLLANIEGLISAQNEPFILLAPSQRNRSAAVQSLLQRHRCAFIPLSRCLALAGKGKFKETDSIQPILDRFTAGLAEGNGLVRTVEKIGRDMEAVARHQYELRKENEELRQLNKDGYFNFAVRVKGDDFLAFAVIMALGNRKAAADHLKIPHRTLYNRVDQWSARGKEYQLMLRYMEWRKRSSRHLKVELNPSLQSGEAGDLPENPETMREVLTEIAAADNRSYPAMFAEVLQALERQNAGNWMKVRQELLEMIKEDVMQ